MRKTTLFLIIISLFLTASLPALQPAFMSGDYRVYTGKSDKNADYKINDFYSVYYVYMNVIRALDINDRLGERDIAHIITLIIDNLKKRKLVQLQIDHYKGSKETLRVTLRSDIDPDKAKPTLWILSNYNASTKQVVSGDDQKDAYATFFYLMGDKLVKYQRVHKPKSEAELKAGSVNSRADYYLLDGDSGNDALGMKLLIQEIEKPGDAPDRPLLYMTLSEYYLLSGDVKNAKQCLDKARAVIRGLNDGQRKSDLLNVMRYCDDLYDYYVKYTGRS